MYICIYICVRGRNFIWIILTISAATAYIVLTLPVGITFTMLAVATVLMFDSPRLLKYVMWMIFVLS